MDRVGVIIAAGLLVASVGACEGGGNANDEPAARPDSLGVVGPDTGIDSDTIGFVNPADTTTAATPAPGAAPGAIAPADTTS